MRFHGILSNVTLKKTSQKRHQKAKCTQNRKIKYAILSTRISAASCPVPVKDSWGALSLEKGSLERWGEVTRDGLPCLILKLGVRTTREANARCLSWNVDVFTHKSTDLYLTYHLTGSAADESVSE